MNYRISLLFIIACLLAPSLHGMVSADNSFSAMDSLLLSAVAHAQEEKSVATLSLLFREYADNKKELRFILGRFLYLWACPEERNAELMQQLSGAAVESDNNWATICTAFLRQSISLQRLVSRDGRKKIVSAYMLPLLLNRADIFCFLAQHAYNQNIALDTTEMSDRGYSLLHFAILLGNRDAIALLQLLGADFKQMTGDTVDPLYTDRTPLELATIVGNQEIITVVARCLQEQEEECVRKQAIAQLKADLPLIFAQREMAANNAAPEAQPAEPTITHPGSDELSSVTEASAQRQLPTIRLGGRSTAYLAALATTDDLDGLEDDCRNPYLGRPLKSPRLRRAASTQAVALPVEPVVPAREESISDAADAIPTVPSHEVVEPIVPVTKPHTHCCAIQ